MLTRGHHAHLQACTRAWVPARTHTGSHTEFTHVCPGLARAPTPPPAFWLHIPEELWAARVTKARREGSQQSATRLPPWSGLCCRVCSGLLTLSWQGAHGQVPTGNAQTGGGAEDAQTDPAAAPLLAPTNARDTGQQPRYLRVPGSLLPGAAKHQVGRPPREADNDGDTMTTLFSGRRPGKPEWVGGKQARRPIGQKGQ